MAMEDYEVREALGLLEHGWKPDSLAYVFDYASAQVFLDDLEQRSGQSLNAFREVSPPAPQEPLQTSPRAAPVRAKRVRPETAPPARKDSASAAKARPENVQLQNPPPPAAPAQPEKRRIEAAPAAAKTPAPTSQVPKMRQEAFASAKVMLVQGEQTIENIASWCGFRSVSAFIAAFEASAGESMEEFLRKAQDSFGPPAFTM